ncbi:hypothetical protein, partial [Burkholderia cenocepacia]|uniref:hypothetical protein n=1 Tax=Burkholderia cenocepacia TaxID=95486 RepID=UPI001BA2B99E
NIDLAQLRHDLFGFVLLLGHSNVLLRLNSLLQGGPLFRGQTSATNQAYFMCIFLIEVERQTNSV